MYDFTNLYNLRSNLTEAIESNDLNRLNNILGRKEKQLSNETNLNFVDKDGETPLHRSCSRGSLGIVKTLVQHGASQCILNTRGFYPIHLAAFYGHSDVVKFLLDSNNFKNQPTPHVNPVQHRIKIKESIYGIDSPDNSFNEDINHSKITIPQSQINENFLNLNIK